LLRFPSQCLGCPDLPTILLPRSLFKSKERRLQASPSAPSFPGDLSASLPPSPSLYTPYRIWSQKLNTLFLLDSSVDTVSTPLPLLLSWCLLLNAVLIQTRFGAVCCRSYGIVPALRGPGLPSFSALCSYMTAFRSAEIMITALKTISFPPPIPLFPSRSVLSDSVVSGYGIFTLFQESSLPFLL